MTIPPCPEAGFCGALSSCPICFPPQRLVAHVGLSDDTARAFAEVLLPCLEISGKFQVKFPEPIMTGVMKVLAMLFEHMRLRSETQEGARYLSALASLLKLLRMRQPRAQLVLTLKVKPAYVYTRGCVWNESEKFNKGLACRHWRVRITCGGRWIGLGGLFYRAMVCSPPPHRLIHALPEHWGVGDVLATRP